ncbi:hypothetical protein Landi51_10020 [Colletotrichum acutatum]
MTLYQDSPHTARNGSSPRPSSVSFTDEAHRSTHILDQQPNNFRDNDSISDYTVVTAEEESRDEVDGLSSASPRGTDKEDLNQTEKNSLLYKPLGRVSTLKQWNLEFAALWTSVIAFIVMVILLVVSNGNPQPTWAYIIGQAKWSWMAAPRPLRHVEHFDNAGHGAWGSLKFLVYVCKSTLTVLGALVVVASYATGPLSQQAVKTYPCEVAAEGIARISIAERVMLHDSIRGSATVNAKMSTTAINGLLAIPFDSSQLFQCESGNCVFQNVSGVTHSSVGLCSKCSDVKSELQEFPDSKTKMMGRFRNNYRFHNDSEFTISTGVEPELFNMTTKATNDESAVRTSFLTLSVAGCIAQPNPDAPADRNCQHDYKDMPRLSSDLDIVAVNCSLYPCLRHYSGSVTNGTLHEDLLSTEPMSRTHGGPKADYVSIIQPCLLNDNWYDLSNITDANRNGVAWTYWTSDGATKGAPAHCVRFMDYEEFYGIRYFLEDNLKGYCKLFDATENGPTSPDAMNGIGNSSRLQCETGWWLDALYNGGKATFDSFAAAHDNMSIAVTNRLRVNGRTWSDTDKSNSYQDGTCSHTSICVRLEEWWLLYPAALLALTSALLVAAISVEYSSDERNEDRYSSQSVPLLQLADMESRADKTIVSFCGGNEGAKFVVEEGVIEAK